MVTGTVFAANKAVRSSESLVKPFEGSRVELDISFNANLVRHDSFFMACYATSTPEIHGLTFVLEVQS